ncbi:insulinoma-associated protein 2 [Lepisosteus oculatus]|uniref:insulinoma-associated protein 2 n=1 Tax=Lepisosteus oculatus TaxID=7918 RepID=UPI003711852A
MPRGFLVKRSKRTCPASYRVRGEDREPPHLVQPSQTAEAHAAVSPANLGSGAPASAASPESGAPSPAGGAQTRPAESAERAGNSVIAADPPQPKFAAPDHGSPGRADASYSPMKPVGAELRKSFFERCLNSPASAESFPGSTPVSPIERLLMQHSHFPPSEVQMETPVRLFSPLHPSMKRACPHGADRRGKPPAKKPKAMRKLHFEDEVTTSPVLGLKIKKESPEPRAAPPAGSGKPLGEFICQLCKEEYPDPFSLAQHKCSRIVRVEYRCPECNKVFSCPANLASHRRWHKPRPTGSGESQPVRKAAESAADTPRAEGKESDQHPRAPDSSGCAAQQRPATDAAAAAEQQQQRYRAPQDSSALPADPCFAPAGKCLAQHLQSVESSRVVACAQAAEATAATYLPGPGGAEEVFECSYCSKKFRRQAYLRKHLAAHETVRSSSYSPLESGQITFPCPLCGAHFPSAEIRDKHRMWHAVRGEILLGPGKGSRPLGRQDLTQGEQQIFSCKHCPSTFFSSPGLTRHINKSHPTESRQVLLLQVPVRPGC